MAKKMSDAVKSRLRAAAAAKKGKTTLKGYDAADWIKALAAAVAAEDSKAPVPRDLREHLRAGGWLDMKVAGAKLERVGKEAEMASWARFRHDSIEHDLELRAAIPHRIVRVDSFDGTAQTVMNVAVFDARKLALLLHRLFPGSFNAAAKKYLVGYTSEYVEGRPGVGQIVKLERPARQETIDGKCGPDEMEPGERGRIVAVMNVSNELVLEPLGDHDGLFRIPDRAGCRTLCQMIVDETEVDGRRERRRLLLDNIFAKFGI